VRAMFTAHLWRLQHALGPTSLLARRGCSGVMTFTAAHASTRASAAYRSPAPLSPLLHAPPPPAFCTAGVVRVLDGRGRRVVDLPARS